MNPLNKLDIIRDLNENFPHLKITNNSNSFAETKEKIIFKKFENGLIIKEINENFIVEKNFLLKLKISVDYKYEKDELLTDDFKRTGNINFSLFMFDTKFIDDNTWHKIYHSYTEKSIRVEILYPWDTFPEILKFFISSNFKNKIENFLFSKYKKPLIFKNI